MGGHYHVVCNPILWGWGVLGGLPPYDRVELGWAPTEGLDSNWSPSKWLEMAH